jgi:hypothetical protein
MVFSVKSQAMEDIQLISAKLKMAESELIQSRIEAIVIGTLGILDARNLVDIFVFNPH